MRRTPLNAYLAVERVFKARVFVATIVYHKFSRAIKKVASPGVTVDWSHRPRRPCGAIMITGSILDHVMKVRADASMMVSSQVVMNYEGKPLWDDFFMTQEGKIAIEALCEDNKRFVYCDEKNRQITTYCADNDHQSLHDQISEIGLFTIVEFRQPLKEDLVQKLNSERLVFIQTLFDVTINLDRTAQPPTMSYTCGMTQARTIQAWLLCLQATEVADLVHQCPICMDNKADENAVNLECGHWYCAECFDGLINMCVQDGHPIRCAGTTLATDPIDGQVQHNLGHPVCERSVTISKLSQVLPPEQLNQKLEEVTTVYLNGHSTTYGYCSTPSCGNVFAMTSEPATFKCPSCENATCTACKHSAHDGQTCAEVKHQDPDELTEEMKKDLGICACPKCHAPYTKNGGCNHMQCKNAECMAHWCYHDNLLFESTADCHAHLNAVHDGLFDADDPNGLREIPPEEAWAAEQAWMRARNFAGWAAQAEDNRLELERDGLQILNLFRPRRVDGRFTRAERRAQQAFLARRQQPIRIAAVEGVAQRRMRQLIEAQNRIYPENRPCRSMVDDDGAMAYGNRPNRRAGQNQIIVQ